MKKDNLPCRPKKAQKNGKWVPAYKTCEIYRENLRLKEELIRLIKKK